MKQVSNKISISKNGRFLIHRTIITEILPTDYYRAVLAGAIDNTETELTDEEIATFIKEGRK